jgi:hypothetical protein
LDLKNAEEKTRMPDSRRTSAERGSIYRGRKSLSAPPPSEPYRRISRIRLSSRWSYLQED